MAWIASPNKPATVSSEKAKQGRRMAEKAAQWVSDNPLTFWELCDIVEGLERTDHLRDRVNMECIRRGVKVQAVGTGDFAFAHALWAPLTRYMVLARPRLASRIRFSESAVDHSGLPEVEEIRVVL